MGEDEKLDIAENVVPEQIGEKPKKAKVKKVEPKKGFTEAEIDSRYQAFLSKTRGGK